MTAPQSETEFETLDTRCLERDGPTSAAEPEFDATPEWFKQEVNPWLHPAFASQPEWLKRKQDRCVRELQALSKLLRKVAAVPFEERKDALNSVLRQANGAFRELEHIEDLLAAIDPTYQRTPVRPDLWAKPVEHLRRAA